LKWAIDSTLAPRWLSHHRIDQELSAILCLWRVDRRVAGQGRSNEEGTNPNSGGTTLYVTPGLRIRFNPHWALTGAVSVPIMQDLNGEQIESVYKAVLAVSWSL